MDFIFDAFEVWLRENLISGIMGNVESMFESINSEVGAVALQVGMTPSSWNEDIFSLIKNLSEQVIMPIAGLILTFVMCYELIQMIIDRNNLHDFPPGDIFKWIMKTFIAVVIVSNTFPIVMAIFDVAQHVVNSASDVIISDATVGLGALDSFETSLEAMETSYLLGLYQQSFLIFVTMKILSVLIFVIVYGRMLEIYLMTSLGALPLATITSKEWNMGQNYIKAMLALAFQAFLIMVCMGMYAVLIQTIVTGDDPIKSIWQCVGYTVLLCFSLFKTGTLSKQIFTAH